MEIEIMGDPKVYMDEEFEPIAFYKEGKPMKIMGIEDESLDLSKQQPRLPPSLKEACTENVFAVHHQQSVPHQISDVSIF